MIPLRRYPVQVIQVYDGDTVVVRIDLGLGVVLSSVHCRLDGIDTAELHASDPELRAQAQKARLRVQSLIPAGGQVEIETTGQEEKFGRLLVRLLIPGVEGSVNDLLIKEGLAKSYHGEKR